MTMVTEFPASNSSIRRRGCGKFCPHEDRNGKILVPVEFAVRGGEGGEPSRPRSPRTSLNLIKLAH
jgi:hypothetical protein